METQITAEGRGIVRSHEEQAEFAFKMWENHELIVAGEVRAALRNCKTLEAVKAWMALVYPTQFTDLSVE